MIRPLQELRGAALKVLLLVAFAVVCGLHRALNTENQPVYFKMAATLWVCFMGRLCLVSVQLLKSFESWQQ